VKCPSAPLWEAMQDKVLDPSRRSRSKRAAAHNLLVSCVVHPSAGRFTELLERGRACCRPSPTSSPTSPASTTKPARKNCRPGAPRASEPESTQAGACWPRCAAPTTTRPKWARCFSQKLSQPCAPLPARRSDPHHARVLSVRVEALRPGLRTRVEDRGFPAARGARAQGRRLGRADEHRQLGALRPEDRAPSPASSTPSPTRCSAWAARRIGYAESGGKYALEAASFNENTQVALGAFSAARRPSPRRSTSGAPSPRDAVQTKEIFEWGEAFRIAGLDARDTMTCCRARRTSAA
jgi:hypothetical protein